MKKKILAIGLCAMMAVSMVACGSKKDNDSGSENVGKLTTSDNSKAEMTGTKYNAKVTLPDYTAMKAGESKANVSEEDIKRINCILLASGYFDINTSNIGHKEGTISNYDVVNIDYVGKLDGEEFEGGSAEGFDLGIGTGSFISGFEDGLIGVKTGETVDLNLTFPEEYQNNPDLAGKDVVFTVTVNYINEITDEFIADNKDSVTYFMYEYFSTCQEFASAEDYHEAVEQGVRVFNIVSDLFQEIKDNSTIEPDEAELAAFIADQKQPYIEYAEQYEVDLETLISSYFGLTSEEEFNEYLEGIYNSYVVMFAIANQEKIEVAEEEYEMLVNTMIAASNGQYEDVESFQADYPKQKTVDDMICGKVYYRIADLVNIVPDDEIETTASEDESDGDASGETQSSEETTVAE